MGPHCVRVAELASVATLVDKNTGPLSRKNELDYGLVDTQWVKL